MRPLVDQPRVLEQPVDLAKEEQPEQRGRLVAQEAPIAGVLAAGEEGVEEARIAVHTAAEQVVAKLVLLEVQEERTAVAQGQLAVPRLVRPR